MTTFPYKHKKFNASRLIKYTSHYYQH